MTTKHVAGYYASWKVYSTCKIEEIDPTLCTILYYAFAGLNEDGTIKVLDHWADIDKGGYKEFTGLKKKNSQLKTLLSVGGWNEGSEKYSNMVRSETNRQAFIKSAINYCQTYGFDGIDFDWEYPCQRGGRPEDKENFSKFLQETYTEFNKHGYLLTVAVAAGESHIGESYDVPVISKNVHYINIMTYDMHSYLDGRTGENSPLFSDDHLNVQYCTKAWISNGANPQKILLGIGSYGKTYTLANSANHGIGAPTSGPGLPGPNSRAAGTLAYDEILEDEKSGWTKQWSDKQQVPYLYSGNQWVGYDDEDSVRKKVEFAKQLNLGGLMMWSVDMDDPRGTCGPSYPLLKTIQKNL
ncbi:hypothetical protein ILUMI_26088 [Ignelater luminosus]|uniref:GH18 domain-containing protein n=1 Tax=Ignelater luminosus TaxID=2038154 RepID=A0A8K0C777_IGNLU|nr:hypothetical protein ILUMI_26088 [Ignelater luminosus]